jgi:hypothetical protein
MAVRTPLRQLEATELSSSSAHCRRRRQTPIVGAPFSCYDGKRLESAAHSARAGTGFVHRKAIILGQTGRWMVQRNERCVRRVSSVVADDNVDHQHIPMFGFKVSLDVKPYPACMLHR